MEESKEFVSWLHRTAENLTAAGKFPFGKHRDIWWGCWQAGYGQAIKDGKKGILLEEDGGCTTDHLVEWVDGATYCRNCNQRLIGPDGE